MSKGVPPAWRSEATAGSTQRTRALPALDPASAPIDERDVPHRLAFAGEYARLLAFYELTGQQNGDWGPFFQQDASFLMAEMSTAYSVEEYFSAVALERKLRVAGDDSALQREGVIQIHGLAARINDWYDRAGRTVQAIQGDRSLQETLEAVIRDDLSKYWFAVKKDWLRDWKDCNPGPFAPVWEEGHGDLPPENSRSERLITILNAFHRATKKLRERALAPLEDLLQQLQVPLSPLEHGAATARSQSNHPPHAALYISFALLMRHVRADLNKFAERHLEYYYRDVLKLREREGAADTAHLYFELAPHAPELALPAGTRLHAGKDAAGGDVLFATQEEVALNAARVSELKTLRVTRPDGSANAGTYVTRIIARPQANSEDGRGKPLQHPDSGWPTFGGELPAGKPDTGEDLDAKVGVVLTSPLLLLTAGQREVAITFRFVRTPDSGKSFPDVLSEYMDALSQSAGASTVSQVPQAPPQLPSDTCLLYVSGEKGWMPIPPPSIKLSHDSDRASIELQFRLPASAPPIVRPANASLVDGVDSAWPMVKVLLNPGARVYAYSFFQQLVLEELCIRVEATGLRDLQIRGPTGPVKSGQPFPVFGAVPVQGASLQIAHQELSTKRLEYVALFIDWIGVPKSFASYYRAYGRQIDDTTFQGKLFLHSGDKYVEEQFALFADRVSATLDLSRDGHAIGAAAGADAHYASLLDTVPAGVLLLELAEPDFAFGHELYPQVVTEAALERTSAVLREVMHQARPESDAAGKGKESQPEKQTDYVKVSLDLADWVRPRGAREPEESGKGPADTAAPAGPGEEGKADASGGTQFPNPPFVPWAKGMSIDYVASACIRFDGQLHEGGTSEDTIELFHLYPFGGNRRRRAGERALFPAFDAEGYLYIGLADLAPPQEITLLFQLQETAAFQRLVGSTVNIDDALGGLRWAYLADDRWREFPDEALIADSTRCLTRSGIVKLRIPQDVTDTNALLPGKLVWIQASAIKNAQSYPNIVGIYPQAVTARRATPMAGDGAGAGLAPQSITELVEKVAAVKAVHQPMATVGGRGSESADQFRIRVSERLRHKQRAIQPFDYERLVLDAFPAVGQARCLTWNATQTYGDKAVKPGTVVVAVVPASDGRPLSLEPRVPYSTLSAIRDYLIELASPSVRDVIVVNPLYERVKLTAEVSFVPGTEPGPAGLRLKADIARHIAPWRSQAEVPMRFGVGLGHVEALRHVIEDLDRVEQVRLESVAVTHDDGSRKLFIAANDEVRGSMPWSVLVPADDQDIRPWSKARGKAAEPPSVLGQGAAPAKAAVRQYFLVIPVKR